MKINELRALIKETISKVLDEAQPAPSKPSTSPGTKPTVHPGKPGTGNPKPRRPLGNPEVKPAPKAMNEEEMLNKIVARFKTKNEGSALKPKKSEFKGFEKNPIKVNKQNTFHPQLKYSSKYVRATPLYLIAIRCYQSSQLP